MAYSEAVRACGAVAIRRFFCLAVVALAVAPALSLFGGVMPSARRVELDAIYVNAQTLQYGKKIESIDMVGEKSDLCFFWENGLLVHPSAVVASSERADLLLANIVVGWLIPLPGGWTVQPSLGYAFSEMKLPIDIPHVEIWDLAQTFRSQTYSVGCDLHYALSERLRATFSYQYGWSENYTRRELFGVDRGESRGSNYSAMVEWDFRAPWSVNLGAAYNSSMSHERNGLRGIGVKLGLARWF